MNKKQLKKFRSMLIEAADAHLKSGGEITSGAFIRSENRCCPIGCVTGTKDNLSYEVMLKEKLGFNITNEEMWDFVFSFDGVLRLENDLTKLGQELRKKYIK
jgi:hypothetical protein